MLNKERTERVSIPSIYRKELNVFDLNQMNLKRIELLKIEVVLIKF